MSDSYSYFSAPLAPPPTPAPVPIPQQPPSYTLDDLLRLNAARGGQPASAPPPPVQAAPAAQPVPAAAQSGRLMTDQEFLGTPEPSAPQSGKGISLEEAYAGAPQAAPQAQGSGISLEDAYMPAKQGQMTDAEFMGLPAPASKGINLDDAYAPAPAGGSSAAGDIAANVGTAVGRIPGAIASLPAVIGHATNWLAAKTGNALGLDPQGRPWTADELDQANPVTRALPTAAGTDKMVFGALDGADRAAGGAGVAPYNPTTLPGRMGQAALTTAGAALTDPLAAGGAAKRTWDLFKAAVAGGSGEGVGEVTDNPLAGALAAVIAHTGTGAAGAAAREAAVRGSEFLTPALNSQAGGELYAGRNLSAAGVDPSLPGPANPSPADLAAATANTQAATGAIPTGSPAWIAGDTTRAGLQSRADALTASRTSAADTAYDAFRAQDALPIDKLQPFMSSPSFRAAIKGANGSVLDEGGQPLTDYFDFNEAGDPALVPNAAVPPDTLDRIKQQLDANVASAGTNTARRTATALQSRFVNFLDDAYPDTYPQARGVYADASRPLDPFLSGPVAKTLDASPSFGGAPQYTLPSERVADLFLRSPAIKSNLDQLVSAYGGDRGAALAGLTDHLAGVAQTAVNPDGTFDAAAFDKAMQPYSKAMGGNVGMYFPQLAQQFGNAKAAQATLDTMNTQAGLASDIQSGALRDPNGIVTGQSMGNWVKQNNKALIASQPPGAALRLQALAKALGGDPASGIESVLTESLPTAIGAKFGGLEGGVLGNLQHGFAAGIFKPQMDRLREAYSQQMERAVMEPAYAQSLMDAYAARPKGMSGARAIVGAMLNGAGQAARVAPLATAAGQSLAARRPQFGN